MWRYDLWAVCMGAGSGGWSNCVRKCLADKWHDCKYDNGFAKDHYDCWFNKCKCEENNTGTGSST